MTENNKTETETDTIEWDAEELSFLKNSMAELVDTLNSKHREIQDKKLLHEEQEIISQEKKLRTKLFSLKLQLHTLKSRKREVKNKRKCLQSANVAVKRFRIVESKHSVTIQPIAKGKVIDCSQDTESESEESDFEAAATPGDTRVTNDGTVEVFIRRQIIRDGIACKGYEWVWVPQISGFRSEFEFRKERRNISGVELGTPQTPSSKGGLFLRNIDWNDENSEPEWFKWFKILCADYKLVWKYSEDKKAIEIQRDPEIITDVVSLEN